MNRMLDGTESLPLLVHSVCPSAQTEERQKESLSAAHLLSLGRRVSFRGHTVAAIPAVIPFGTCLDCSQRIANIIIINSFIVLWKTSRETSFVPNGSGTNAGLFLSETYI
jgi:hypothetical protein